MLHLSELHGAATHLAVVAIPLYAIVLIVRRTGIGHPTLLHVEPWALGAAVAGMVASGVTGLLVRGQAQTVLRDGSGRLGAWHLWLGIALALVLAALAAWRLRRVRAERSTHGTVFLAGGAIGVLLVLAQGYVGGRMTYDQGVGVDGGGQFAQTAAGAARLERALAAGQDPARAGKAAFAESGLGCASCHGDQAQGARGPRLAGGAELPDFRRVHAAGLFPPGVLGDADFEAIDAYLRTLGPPRGG
ncbi:MAG: hypothetical protein QOF17_589 [Solirubrobacteraceae bacterium]|jgi:uncharacterized membrane protein|nr:hypothetical protein [Solirubrobacteraceae bacterium]